MNKIGIIGGSGLDDPSLFEDPRDIDMDTPWGKPSCTLREGLIGGVPVVLMARHGREHTIPPTQVNYRANIWALKEAGCTHILASTAVGSLREEIGRGDLILPDQFIDFTKNRDYTYFDDSIVHISIPEPFCGYLNGIFIDALKEAGLPHHTAGRYMCIEGPRFSTRAESFMFRNFADIIGMTVSPEVQLARELGMCYCSIATITDYDVWKDEVVDIQMVKDTMARCLMNVQTILEKALPRIQADGCTECIEAARGCGAL